MPYQFQYLVFENDNYHLRHIFEENLHCQPCQAITNHGQPCQRNTCIGIHWCYQHLASIKHLRIQPSTIPNAGKGLYAIHRDLSQNAIVFKKGDIIIDYDGEFVTHPNLNQRYLQENTAPYAITINHTWAEDAALSRGVGAFANQALRATQINAKFSAPRPGTNLPRRHTRLVATKNIRNGQEIFIDYGNVYRLHEPHVSYRTKYVRR
jgi:hypothetical protein